MNKRSFAKKPLYRQVNTRTHVVRHGGGHARWDRNTKAAGSAHASKMKSGFRHGPDYTPLYRFLLKKVGQPWSEVHSEAVSRLPDEEPIWYIVASVGSVREPIYRTGESSYFSGLYVNETGHLALVVPSLSNNMLWPACACCTHSFNGTPFVNSFDPSRADDMFRVLSEWHRTGAIRT